jgi:molybdopterin synthase sulfur carrier subunit
MSVKVRIPSPLRSYSGGADVIEVSGANVGEALNALKAKAAGIETRLFKGPNQLNRFVNVYLNDEDIRFLQNLETPVKEGDELSIVPAIAGGGPPAPHNAEFVVSDMRVRTVPGFAYLYDRSQTSIPKIADVVRATLPGLQKGMSDGKFRPAGPLVLIYQNMTDRSQPFTLDIGFIVSRETVGFEQFKVRQENTFRCATVLFSGPISSIPQAYDKLMSAVSAAELKPTMTFREINLFWEGPESPNNVIQIQAGIQ